MIVICCPVEGRLWPGTAAALAEYAPQAEIIPIPADEIWRPWADYASRWGKDDLVVIEQDVIIHGQVLPQFESCPEPWCLFPARHYARARAFMDSGIMCNRFRTEFMQAVPVAAVEAVPGSCPRCDGGKDPRCWAHLDGRTRAAGEAAGFRIHVHWPSVGHRDEGLPGELRPEGWAGP